MAFGGRRDLREGSGMYSSYSNPADDMTNFDPECAICGAPPDAKCGCESVALDKAVRMAEERMMNNHFRQMREWVRLNAQDYILKYYEALSERKKDDHHRHIEYLQAQASNYYGYHVRVPPDQIAMAEAKLRAGLDECWKQSVNRYPEVLEYYYSLITFKFPRDDDLAVTDPSLSALMGASRRGPEPVVRMARDPRRGDRRTPVPESRPRPPAERSSFSRGAYGGYDEPKYR